MSFHWLILFCGGLLELGWAFCLQRSNGMRNLGWTIAGLILAFASLYALARAMERLPVATSYAVWAGIGAVGTSIMSFVFLKEGVSPLKVLCIGLIILGTIGLRFEEGKSSENTLPENTHIP